ncbi:MAG: AmpG family muropeptide MFS transporter [Pseudomonadales bacterium]|nr:AmpG family muropeptide MFS transporter [Pseudomonadales bacterium]
MKHSNFIRESGSVLFSPRMLITFAMGFSCGLPLLLTISVLQIWMRQAGVNLETIGLMALVGLPYTLKFLWAPLLDRYSLPLGRRRGWLFLTQITLMLCIGGLGYSDPANHPYRMALFALAVAFFSATQDAVVDAYRREHLPERELGLGSTIYVYGYRIGMLLASGGGLILADQLSFPTVYLIMAGTMFIGIATTLLAPEPEMATGAPQNLSEAVIKPFVEFFKTEQALLMLLFILLYKLGDTLASAMTAPFYVDMGFSATEIGLTVKLYGFWATIIGALIGAGVILKIGIRPSLWVFGILQMVSTAGFMLLALAGHSLPTLALVITFENLAAGMGTAAFMAFMASLTDKRFTATQFALLTSIMGVPRVILSAPTGFLAADIGWFNYFLFCTLIALPGLWLLRKFNPQNTG